MWIALLVVLAPVALLTAYYWLLRLAARYVHPRFALALGVISVAALCWVFNSIGHICDAPPTYRPPEPGMPGEGTMVFACDSGVGVGLGMMMLYVMIIIGGAVEVTDLVWRRTRRRADADAET